MAVSPLEKKKQNEKFKKIMDTYYSKHRVVLTKNDNFDTSNPQFFLKLCVDTLEAVVSGLTQGIFPESGQGTEKITNYFGWYAIVNLKSKKVMFGSSTSDFSRRKADYKRDFREFRNNPKASSPRLYASLRQEITKNGCSENDFVFVPLVLLDKAYFNSLLDKKEKTNWVQDIEHEVLKFFLESTSYKGLFYNTKASSKFEVGNTSGGFRAGKTSPVAEVGGENPLAYESKMAASKILKKDRKSIRNYVDRGKFKEISVEEWNAWPEDRKRINPYRD